MTPDETIANLRAQIDDLTWRVAAADLAKTALKSELELQIQRYLTLTEQLEKSGKRTAQLETTLRDVTEELDDALAHIADQAEDVTPGIEEGLGLVQRARTLLTASSDPVLLASLTEQEHPRQGASAGVSSLRAEEDSS
jgi:chromosome segregation ATPase